jgi:hypothetical protein
MADRYTKIVLTVIAAALVMLVIGSRFEPRGVVAQGPECGGPTNP